MVGIGNYKILDKLKNPVPNAKKIVNFLETKNAEIYAAYPCPFPPVKDRAYYHFTGNIKPWTKWNPKNKQFQLWYDAVSASGDVSVQNDVFDGKILKE